MKHNPIKKIWTTPILISLVTAFGLMAALLGTGYWYFFSWFAMIIPILIVMIKLMRPKLKRLN